MCAALKLAVACAVATSLLTYCQIDKAFSENHQTYLRTYETDSNCDENALTLEVQTDAVDNPFKQHDIKQNKVLISYGNALLLACYGGDVTQLAIKKDGETLLTEKFSEGIKWFERRPETQKSEYMCTSNVCKRSMIVTVTPAFKIISPNLQISSDKFNKIYTIPYGYPMSVLCSGPAASRLVITKDGELLQAEKVTNNTIKWSSSKPDLQISEYICTDVDAAVNRTLGVRVEPAMYIGARNESRTVNISSHPTLLLKYGLYTYGDTVEVFCSGPRAVKLLNLRENKELLMDCVNNITVKSLIRNLKLGDSVIGCIDSEVPEFMSTVRLEVRPRIDVSSPNIRRIGREYITKYGDSVDIVCSGPDSEKLFISTHTTSYVQSTKHPVIIVNETTVKWVLKKPDIDSYIFYCSAEEDKVVSEVFVTVDAFAEALGFRCVSHDLEYLNCTWKTVREGVSFRLFYIEEGKPTFICSEKRLWKTSSNLFCVWHGTDYTSDLRMVGVFSFIMESCNYYGCVSQKFVIDHLSIVKPSAPWGLRVHNTSSYAAVLRWGVTYIYCAGQSRQSRTGDFDHKVEYWYSGTQPVEVNSSLVSCRNEYCEIELDLPCPGQSYQVWVYHKLKESIGTGWSEPSLVTFQTKGENTPEVNSKCNWNPKKTKEVMIYFVQKLKQEVHLEMPHLKEKLRLLKKKRALIHTYLEQQNTKDHNS